MKNISFIVYDLSEIGGVEQATVNLANSLSRIHNVEIITICLKKDIIYNLEEQVKVIKLLDSELRLRDMRKKVANKLVKHLKTSEVDIAIIQGTYAGFITSNCRFKVDSKIVFCDHGALLNEWKKAKVTLMRLMSSIYSHKIVSLTNQNANDYNKKFMIPLKKIKVIPNFIDIECMDVEPYNVNSKKIISVGRFSKEKGFDLLVQSFAQVSPQYPEWSLDIYGDGEMMDTVKALIDEYDLNDKIILKGMCNDVQSKYKEYAMYVLPSYREGLPLVLLEAKANHLPIVSFDIVTGPRDIINDGINGILIPPYDISKFSDAICDLIVNTEKRQSMSKHSYDNIEKFSKSNVLAEWMKLIDELCDQ